jgi:hypothetical protein
MAGVPPAKQAEAGLLPYKLFSKLLYSIQS